MAGIILVRDIMTKDVKKVRSDSTVADVVRKMNKFDIGSVVVVQGERPVGIITERDILRKIVEPRIDPTAIKAKQIMSSPLITVNEDTNLEEAARLMTKNAIKKLPVIRNGKLVGIVTTMDLARAEPRFTSLIEEFARARRKEN